jgi:hypothetical protein
MAVRRFHDRAGQEWSVWRVQPTSSTAGLQERFQAGWLCFERGDGEGRARLPLDEAPPAWEALPDERLELLCRVAEVASRPRGVTPPDAIRAQQGTENSARSRTSGPRRAVSPDERT